MSAPRMTQAERCAWLAGEDMPGATRGAYACDDCGAPSCAIGHRGGRTMVFVLCAECYLAMCAEARRARGHLRRFLDRGGWEAVS